MTVIDLGERRDTPAPADPGPRRFLRRWAPALVVLLCLVAPTAAAPWPTQPPVATVPAGPDVQVLPFGDVLLVADGPESAAGPTPLLAAYQLPTGRPLWRVPLPGPGRAYQAVRVGDLVVLGVMVGAQSPSEVVGLSAADGGVRWRVEGRLHGTTPAGHLLVWGVDASGVSVLRSLDPAGGAARWSQRLAAEDVHAVRRDLRVSLLAVLAGGQLELRDPDTGAVLRGTSVPASAGRPRVLDATAELVLLSDGLGALTAYETATLRRRWSLPPGPADQPDAADCGPLICVDDGSPATRLLDPVTGETRWRSDIGPLLGPVGNRMLAVRSASGILREHVLLDAATGQPVRNLGRWQVASDILVLSDATFVSRRQRDGRVLVGRIDERGDGVQVLAALHGVVGVCGVFRSFVLCRREGGALGVWELPDAR
ncbi:PQQ-binding-like beta-propeller repeat protein [Micromonospora sp. NPDC048170]|uniref:outer membrane protein assembly factor BamB family protein n=1 Tax=Micromonospora sp. NPDC048170 TaxID=3154819 RepID=UPI0033F771E0